jgi:hypothetical protein
MQDNVLTGSIPSEISRLTRLGKSRCQIEMRRDSAAH